MAETSDKPSFLARLGLAFRVLGNAELASRVLAPSPVLAAPAPKPESPAPAPQLRVRDEGDALLFLSLLQREGRLVDFLREDVTSFGDADVGAAARVVHAGCRKVLDQYLSLTPACEGLDGDAVTLPAGFDKRRIRLTGNVAGQPPFTGTLKHHGWVVSDLRLPETNEAVDPRVLAPAEVEL